MTALPPANGARRGRRASLLANARFRLLFLANLGSGLGNWLAIIALQVDVYDRTHSGWWVAALLAASILPAVFLGLLFGPVVDRVSRKGLMIGSDLLRLAVFVALPFVGSAGAIVALAVLAGIGNAFFRPAVLAGLPNLVAEDELSDANAALQLVEWITIAGGPLVGGALVAASGPPLAYWVNAATFALSAALVAGIPAKLLQSERAIGRGHWIDLREGFELVLRTRVLLTVLVAWSIAMVANGGVNVAEVFLAKSTFHAGDFGFGLLWAGTGVGLIGGGLVASRLIDRGGIARTYASMLLVFALGIAGAAASPNVWFAVGAMAVSGFGNGAAIVANITLVQRGASDNLRGRAFTTIMSANYAMLLVAFVGAGPLTNAFGARWVYAVAAGALVVSAGAARVLMRGHDEAAA